MQRLHLGPAVALLALTGCLADGVESPPVGTSTAALGTCSGLSNNRQRLLQELADRNGMSACSLWSSKDWSWRSTFLTITHRLSLYSLQRTAYADAVSAPSYSVGCDMLSHVDHLYATFGKDTGDGMRDNRMFMGTDRDLWIALVLANKHGYDGSNPAPAGKLELQTAGSRADYFRDQHDAGTVHSPFNCEDETKGGPGDAPGNPTAQLQFFAPAGGECQQFSPGPSYSGFGTWESSGFGVPVSRAYGYSDPYMLEMDQDWTYFPFTIHASDPAESGFFSDYVADYGNPESDWSPCPTSCRFDVAPQSFSVDSSDHSVTVSITNVTPDCIWEAAGDAQGPDGSDTWISANGCTPLPGSGLCVVDGQSAGTVTFSIAANGSTSARSGFALITAKLRGPNQSPFGVYVNVSQDGRPGCVDQGCGCGNPPPNGCGQCGCNGDPNACNDPNGTCCWPSEMGCDGICFSGAADSGCGCGQPAPNACGCTGQVDLGCGCGQPAPDACGCAGQVDLGCGCGNPAPNSCGCTGQVDQGCGCGGPAPNSCGCSGDQDLGCGCGAPPPNGCGQCGCNGDPNACVDGGGVCCWPSEMGCDGLCFSPPC